MGRGDPADRIWGRSCEAGFMDDLNSIKLTGGFAFPSNVRRIVVLTAAPSACPF